MFWGKELNLLLIVVFVVGGLKPFFRNLLLSEDKPFRADLPPF
jgi:hypothetical protein